MKTTIKRCAHCGQEYSYQMSGEGCNATLNNGKYCPDCMLAIIHALDKIPVRFEPRWNTLKTVEDSIKNDFKELYTKELEIKNDSFVLPRAHKLMYLPNDIVSAVEVNINFIKYLIISPTENLLDENAKWERYEEYNIVENKFTGKIWYSSSRSEYCPILVTHFTKFDPNIEEKPQPPVAKLFYIDPIFNDNKGA